MYAAVSRFEDAAAPTVVPPVLERAEGVVRIGFEAAAGASRLVSCYQRGSLKVRFPRLHDTAVPEAVLLNTAGGITGGDRFAVAAELGAGAALTLTAQAAERIYRSAGGDGSVDVALTLGSGARLAWLPQETILFHGGRLARSLSVDMAPDARLVLCESLILGRAAHGETVRAGLVSDRWRVRRGGRLVYADNLTLHGMALHGGSGAAMEGRATLRGGRAFASLLIVAPTAEATVDAVRDVLADCPATGGASAWNGMLSVRLVAADGAALKASVFATCVAAGLRLPRAWSV